MRIRKIAVFIDGGFFLKRLPRIVEKHYRDSPERVAETARILCKKHILRLVGKKEEEDGRWLDHAYRFFYYDAWPFEGESHHPLTNRHIQFKKTNEAEFRRKLFDELKKKRKFALRLGRVEKTGGWQITDDKILKRLLITKKYSIIFKRLVNDKIIRIDEFSEEEIEEIKMLSEEWTKLSDDLFRLSLRQKGVDMRLGIDIASITLKRQADTLILVTGDSDFVPAAKLARREGAEVILDPLGQSVNPELYEHIDGLYSVLGKDHSESWSQQQEKTPLSGPAPEPA